MTIPLPRGRLSRRLARIEPVMLLWVLLITILVFLVAFPLGKLLLESFETRGTGEFTLTNCVTAYSRSRYVDALVNSLLLDVVSATMAVVMAVRMAWAVLRADMPGKGLTWAVVLGAFILPRNLGAVGWILLAGPNLGFLNILWCTLTGTEQVLFNVYSFEGMVLVTALNSFPLVFIFVKAVLDLIPSEMEVAVNILGAGTLTVMRKVSLPLV